MALAYDNSSSQASGVSPASPLTWSHTTTGSNLILVVGVAIQGTNSVTSIKYNNVSMTSIRSDTGSTGKSYLYYLINPATGANTVSVAFSGSPTDLVGGAISLTGAKQTGQPDANNGNNGALSNPNVSVTTVADSAWVIDAVCNQAGTALTVGSGQTQRVQTAGPAGARLSMSHEGPKTPAGAVSMDWASGNNAVWAQSAVSILPLTIVTDDNSSKANILATLSQDGSVKLNIEPKLVNSAKSNIKTTYYTGDSYDWKPSLDPTGQNRGWQS